MPPHLTGCAVHLEGVHLEGVMLSAIRSHIAEVAAAAQRRQWQRTAAKTGKVIQLDLII